VARKTGRIVHNIKEHKGIKMSVIVVNVRTHLFDENTCVGFTLQIRVIYESVRMLVRAISVL